MSAKHEAFGRLPPGMRAGAERVKWHLRLFWARAAWPQFLVSALFLFALGLGIWGVLPLHRDVQYLQGIKAENQPAEGQPSDLGASQAQRPTPPPLAQTTPARGSAAYVDGLVAFLPSQTLREQQRMTLYSLAAGNGVDLMRVDYGHSQLEQLPVQRVSLLLTLGASYAAYRQFLHQLLVAIPNLAVDRVTVEQVPGNAVRLNVRLEVSLYYQRAAPPPIVPTSRGER